VSSRLPIRAQRENRVIEGLDPGDEPLGPFVNEHALDRERGTPGRAFEEPQRPAPFDRAHALRHRLLRNTQRICGRGQAAVRLYRRDRAQFLD